MNHARGIVYLVSYYRCGFGTNEDEHKAFEYYQKAADMLEPEGLYQVGLCYGEGIGIDENEQKAFEYFQKAATMGHDIAKFTLENKEELKFGKSNMLDL